MDIDLSFEDLDGQTSRCMPGNVAMHQPGARVVGAEGNDEISASGQQCHVSARWVVGL